MACPAKKTQLKSLEQRLRDAADALRGNQEPSEYKHGVLCLVFLKYISDRFEERRRALEATLSDPNSDDYIPKGARRQTFLEDRGEYDYPPNHEEKAIQLVLQQAELFAGSGGK